MRRRAFLRTAAAGAASLVVPAAATSWSGAAPNRVPAKANWPIGCFNRAWRQWSYDETLDAIKAAGYSLTGLLSGHPGEAFTGIDATPAYLDALKARIASRGLRVNMSTLRFAEDGALVDNIAAVRKQIEHASRLEVPFLLTFGVDKPEHYENFYRLMSDAAAEADKRKIRLAMKPHGGGSGASDEIVRAIEKIGHPNFSIWYDAGNIIYYTGKDPVAELAPIVRHVTGLCAKDCPAPKGEVMTQFGTGKVDFPAVFKTLQAAGFNGPVMVEGIAVGASAAETARNAGANREFLERTFAAL